MADPHAWAESFFALVDRFDADAVASRMTPQGVLISGNNEPVVGRDGTRDAIHWFERALASISHEVLHAWQVDGTLIAELRITYVRHDGGKVVLPCTNIVDLTDNGLISKYQVFMDMAPVFA